MKDINKYNRVLFGINSRAHENGRDGAWKRGVRQYARELLSVKGMPLSDKPSDIKLWLLSGQRTGNNIAMAVALLCLITISLIVSEIASGDAYREL